eukprot:g3858.t1
MKRTSRVKSFIRCRPANKREIESGDLKAQTIRCKPESAQVHVTNGKLSTCFQADNVFSEDATQEEVYRRIAEPIEEDVIEGFSCVIFAYGQTGTGKTHTMEGSLKKGHEMAGIIPRMCESLFDKLVMQKLNFTLKATAVELYCERFYDCIGQDFREKKQTSSNGADVEKPIKIVDGAVTNCEEILVQSPEEIYKVLQHAKDRRHISATKMNKQSSRSHFIFMLSVRVRIPSKDGSEDEIKNGKLYLVDLAGSESIGKSGAEGLRATEAKLINKSNEALKRVIESLVNNWSHIPYRDSRLTQLLRPALGGSAKTAIIGTISPAHSSLFESKSTLHYMCMAKQIKNRPKVNQSLTQKTLVADLEREQDRLRAQLAAQRAKAGVYIPHEQYEEQCEQRKRLEAKVSAFNEVLSKKDKELEASVKAMNMLQVQFETVRLKCEAQRKEIEKTNTKLVQTTKCLRKETGRANENAGLATAREQYGLQMRDAARVERAELMRLGDVAERGFAKKDRLSAALDKRESEARALRDATSSWRDDVDADAKRFESNVSDHVASIQNTIKTWHADSRARLSRESERASKHNDDVLAHLAAAEGSLKSSFALIADVGKEETEGALKSCKSVDGVSVDVISKSSSLRQAILSAADFLPALQALTQQLRSSSSSKQDERVASLEKEFEECKFANESIDETGQDFATKFSAALEISNEKLTSMWRSATKQVRSERESGLSTTFKRFDDLQKTVDGCKENMTSQITSATAAANKSLEVAKEASRKEIDGSIQIHGQHMKDMVDSEEVKFEASKSSRDAWAVEEKMQYSSMRHFCATSANDLCSLMAASLERSRGTVNDAMKTQNEHVASSKTKTSARWCELTNMLCAESKATALRRKEHASSVLKETSAFVEQADADDEKAVDAQLRTFEAFGSENRSAASSLVDHVKRTSDAATLELKRYCDAADELATRAKSDTTKRLRDQLEETKAQNRALRAALNSFAERAQKDRDQMRVDIVKLLDTSLKAQAEAQTHHLSAILDSVQKNESEMSVYTTKSCASIEQDTVAATNARRAFFNESASLRKKTDEDIAALVSARSAALDTMIQTFSKSSKASQASRGEVRSMYTRAIESGEKDFEVSESGMQDKQMSDLSSFAGESLTRDAKQHAEHIQIIEKFVEKMNAVSGEANQDTIQWREKTTEGALEMEKSAKQRCDERSSKLDEEDKVYMSSRKSMFESFRVQFLTHSANCNTRVDKDAAEAMSAAEKSCKEMCASFVALGEGVTSRVSQAIEEAKAYGLRVDDAATDRQREAISTIADIVKDRSEHMRKGVAETGVALSKCTESARLAMYKKQADAKTDFEESTKLCDSVDEVATSILDRVQIDTDTIENLAGEITNTVTKWKCDADERMSKLIDESASAMLSYQDSKSSASTALREHLEAVRHSFEAGERVADRGHTALSEIASRTSLSTSNFVVERLQSHLDELIVSLDTFANASNRRPDRTGKTPNRAELQIHRARNFGAKDAIPSMPILHSPISTATLRGYHRAATGLNKQRRDDNTAATSPMAMSSSKKRKSPTTTKAIPASAAVVPPLPPAVEKKNIATLEKSPSTAKITPPIARKNTKRIEESKVLRPRKRRSLEEPNEQKTCSSSSRKKGTARRRRRASVATSSGSENWTPRKRGAGYFIYALGWAIC